MSESVQGLFDRADLTDIVYVYGRAVDNCDWKLYRTLFTDMIEVDMDGVPTEAMSADSYIDRARSLVPGFDLTHHQLTNLTFEISDDAATVTVYMRAEHFLNNADGDNSHTMGGYYVFKMKRTIAGWKIYSYRLVVTWTRGNRGIYALAIRRVKDGLGRKSAVSGG